MQPWLAVILVALPDISNGSNNIVGYCLVVAGVLSAAFYVVISSRLIKSFEPITLLSGQLTFSLILSSLFAFISKSSIYLPLELRDYCFFIWNITIFFSFLFLLELLALAPSSFGRDNVVLYSASCIITHAWLLLDRTIHILTGGGILL
ncbi:EamA family transporter (plasmid) [Escherichia coli]